MAALIVVLGTLAQADPLAVDSRRFSEGLQSQAHDEAANPGMLWVHDGGLLWHEVVGAAQKSCASCHGDAATSMPGVSSRYPAVDATRGELLNLEGRINSCRSRYQRAPPLAYESDELLGLTAFVANQSRGHALRVATDGPAAKYAAEGRAFFNRRQGQLNLACAQCHENNVGRRLRSDTISAALPNGYPAYRLEWQTLGSLQRRLRACSAGVRAVQFDYGSREYLSLELYLAARANGVMVETPALRR